MYVLDVSCETIHMSEFKIINSKLNVNLRGFQVCLGKFHSVWVCGSAEGGEVWCAGQPARAGGPNSTALRPLLLRLPEHCIQAAITLTSTIFLLQSGAVSNFLLKGLKI